MRLYNTLSRKVEDFQPLSPPAVTYYTCGPTVYDFTHIGHMRTYTNNDALKRALTYLGYKVKHVMNITDVGHLTGDDDSGEDKLEKGAKKAGKTVWDVAKFYTDHFFRTMDSLNIHRPDIISKATDHIEDMIKLTKLLQEKGFTYETNEAVYFDTSKFKNYGKLSGQKLEEKLKGAREEVYIDPQKKHPSDFSLWFKRVGRFTDHSMYWKSPWGDGFPGWHIECSAMSMKYLGETIDIHAGGVDHIAVHHENEIAQSEGSTGKQFVKYWLHNEFLLVDGEKMSKSKGNIYTLEDIIKRGIDPLSLRLLFYQSHYRQQMNFTWESANAAHEAYKKLKNHVVSLRSEIQRTQLSEEKLDKLDTFREKFKESLENDLQLTQSLAIMWEVLKSNIPSTDKLDLLFNFDEVLGLNLSLIQKESIPGEIHKLAVERQRTRESGDYKKSDALRKELDEKGYIIEDAPEGHVIKRK